MRDRERREERKTAVNGMSAGNSPFDLCFGREFCGVQKNGIMGARSSLMQYSTRAGTGVGSTAFLCANQSGCATPPHTSRAHRPVDMMIDGWPNFLHGNTATRSGPETKRTQTWRASRKKHPTSPTPREKGTLRLPKSCWFVVCVNNTPNSCSCLVEDERERSARGDKPISRGRN